VRSPVRGHQLQAGGREVLRDTVHGQRRCRQVHVGGSILRSPAGDAVGATNPAPAAR
jgi:hypothetical protein